MSSRESFVFLYGLRDAEKSSEALPMWESSPEQLSCKLMYLWMHQSVPRTLLLEI